MHVQCKLLAYIFFEITQHQNSKLDYSAMSFALRCCNVSAGWKSLISLPTSLDKHIKRINEILRAWRTCKLRDLNNGWTDKTGLAIYPTVFPPSSRLSHGFFLPSVRHVSSWFSTTQPIQFLKRRPLRISRPALQMHLIYTRLQRMIWALKWMRHHAFTQI